MPLWSPECKLHLSDIRIGMGIMKITISGLHPLMVLHTKLNLVKIGPVVYEAKMSTDDVQRRTPTHNNRPPE